jgi:beta-1,4-mannosyltransferase
MVSRPSHPWPAEVTDEMVVRVLSSPARAAQGSNPYPTLWTTALTSAGIDVTEYSDLALIRNRWDYVHFHWPERVVARVGRSPRRFLIRLARVVALALARRRGARVVWTVHNDRPHDLGRHWADRLTLWLFQHLVDVFVVLSDAQAVTWRSRARGRPVLSSPHPLYQIAPVPVSTGTEEPRWTFTCFGEIRPYKGQLDLVRAFPSFAEPGQQLLIVGAARPDDSYSADLRRAVDATPGVRWIDERLDDDALDACLRASQVVVLPYRRVLNSGSAMRALQLHRPVVLPDTPDFRDLRREVGNDWVHLYSDLGVDFADAASRAVQRIPSGAPTFSRRSWSDVGNVWAALIGQAVRP